MLDRLLPLVALVAFTTLPACASEDTDLSPADVSEPSTEPDGSERLSHQLPTGRIDRDGVHGPDVRWEAEPSAPSIVALSMEGAVCSVAQTGMVREGEGWTVHSTATCGTSKVALKISGRTDVRYPQTALVPFREEQAVTLLVWDYHQEQPNTFTTSGDDAVVYLESGPTADGTAPVEGSARVIGRDTTRKISFKLHY